MSKFLRRNGRYNEIGRGREKEFLKFKKLERRLRSREFVSVKSMIIKHEYLIYENIPEKDYDVLEYLLLNTDEEGVLGTLIDIIKVVDPDQNKPYISLLVKNKKRYRDNPIEYDRLFKLLVVHKKGNVNAVDKEHKTALFYTDKVDSSLLLSNGIDLNVQDKDGNTFLHYRIKKELDLSLFMNRMHKMDLSLKDKNGFDILGIAISKRNYSLSLAILKNYPDLHLTKQRNNWLYLVLSAPNFTDLQKFNMIKTTLNRDDLPIDLLHFVMIGLYNIYARQNKNHCKFFSALEYFMANIISEIQLLGKHSIKKFIKFADSKKQTILHKVCQYPLDSLIFTIKELALENGIKFEKDTFGMYPSYIYINSNPPNYLIHIEKDE